jgi:Tfp pilus assembly protein FimT
MVTIDQLLIGIVLIAILGILAWPKRGVLARWCRHVAAQQQALAEDALKQLFASAWQGRSATLNPSPAL